MVTYLFKIENLVVPRVAGSSKGQVSPVRGGVPGKDCELYCSTEVFQNIKFQAPNYKQISNSNTK